jgi:uncharacterized membrane protein
MTASRPMPPTRPCIRMEVIMNDTLRNAGLPARIIITVLIFFVLVPAGLWAQPKPAAPVTSADGRRIIIPQGKLSTTASFFSYKTRDNVQVRFFTILDRANKVHIAFDACDVCYQAKRGYRIIGGFAICNNCGQRFPLAAIGTDNIRGGCWPSYLPVKTAGGRVEVAVSDIEKKEFLFK